MTTIHPYPPLDADGKGLGRLDGSCSLEQVPAMAWNLLAEDVSLPVAVLYETRVRHNLEWMQRFIRAYKVQLAPHGKTTMSPALFKRQLDGGAWGITLATAPQVNAAYRHGVRRILMANQLVGRANMALVADLLRDPDFTFYCIVDSAANAAALGAFFAARGQTLRVLVELGVAGGRTGVRDDQQLDTLLAEIAKWPGALALSGIEIYEGVLQDEAQIRAFLRRATGTLRNLQDNGQLATDSPALISGAGSAWYDVVAEEFSGLDIGRPLEIVLRPGCYLSHDVGIYRGAATRINANNEVARHMEPGLLPALQVWAYVQSLPEPGRAIIGLGKRDAAFDAGLPTPALHYRPNQQTGQTAKAAATAATPATAAAATKPANAPPAWKLTAMMDQHAFMQIDDGADIQVGDMIGFDISHPCLTFDKWKQVLLVNDDYQVLEAVQTFF
ncbi:MULTISPECIES: amino acid deaminase [unclassified Achromobacter]|uniref:amino acid deaminase n=1 Tax=unclassified Achromobacter TaxID=2626865 RepID=UPI000B5199BE|nr:MULTISPECIES: amino acid deaminase [unclassified Achromobacter]OWT72870.1 amino acid deaminase [Achromobacter sp. HZ34]OWT74088.1 amino acid deaminase [Achromobacter sp. HZ28]